MYDKLEDFDFYLPKNLIAQYPLPNRSDSRLLAINLNNSQMAHQKFTDLLSWVKPGDLCIFNNTKVIPARLWGHKLTGGKIECLIERVLSDQEALAHIRSSKSPKTGSQIRLADAVTATIMGRQDDLFHLHFDGKIPLFQLLNQYGSIPLPSYIDRPHQNLDLDRYQTVFGHRDGAVAAPTAGLHFDAPTLSALQAKGVHLAYITLHIGAGTFQPVRVTELNQHKMHTEYMEISEEICREITLCRERGGRVFAVGTTVARCLETAAQQETIVPFTGYTNIFIRPGFKFKCVDALLTNFHLPKSTLLMLVTAFGGYDPVMAAYQSAVENNYRFFSYGDAMLLAKA